MSALNYTAHKKLSLRQHPTLNEQWLHDRICEDPSILGLGDVRVLDRERTLTGGGRLDLLLLDDDNDRRYEVEIQLGGTDPSHIIRSIEYWDLERRRYPAYEHIAVIIAEDITTRFLNVMGLMSGSIPMIAIQLDALTIENHIILNFVQVLDLTELRADDTTDPDAGGKSADRSYWDAKAGQLMPLVDTMIEIINRHAKATQEPNYLQGDIGLKSNGVVRNVFYIGPRHTKNFLNVTMQISQPNEWKDRFEEAGIPVQSKRSRRLQIKPSKEDFQEHAELIEAAVKAAVEESGI